MKRFAFIATLFGFGEVAKAQHDGVNTNKPYRREQNSCPICGTVADWPTNPKDRLIEFGESEEGYSARTPGLGFSVPQQLVKNKALTECSQCTAAFWIRPLKK